MNDLMWTELPDTICPAGWIVKERRAKLGRFTLHLSAWMQEMEWAGSLPGVCCTGNYATEDAAKAALLRLVRKALQGALDELGSAEKVRRAQ